MTGRMIIPTARDGLVLRELGLGDENAFAAFAGRNRSQIIQYIGHGSDISEEQFARCSSVMPEFPGLLSFGICEGLRFVGYIQARPPELGSQLAYVGYWVDANYTGRGIATQAVRALSNFMVNHELFLYLRASARKENVASRKVLGRAGYVYECESEGLLWFARCTTYAAEW